MNKKQLVKISYTFVIGPVMALLLVMSGTLSAGEITSLSWAGDNVLDIGVSGSAEYKVESFEEGKRLRISFPGSTLGANVAEPGGRSGIKGVYPYLADNGATVNIDILATTASKLNVTKTGSGYQVAAASVDAAPATEPEVVATTPASVPEQVVETAAPVQTAVAPVVLTQKIEPAPVQAPASQAPANAITDISFVKLPGSRVQIRLKMAGNPIKPRAFTITNPARIAFDFDNTELKASKRTLRVGVGAVVSVNAVAVGNRTRVVLNLVRPVGYETGIVDNDLVFTLDSPVTAIGGAVAQNKTRFATKTVRARYSIKNIDFRRGTAGDAKIIVTLSDPSIGIDVKEQAGDIILDFLNTNLPANLERRLDVVDFATPVQTIDMFGQGNNARMVITPIGKYEHLAYQTGNTFTLNIRPITVDEDESRKDEFGYSGEKLSLNFQNIEVRAALQVLADFTDLNFVVSDTVGGELTLRLKDVPWDQALDIILDAKALSMRKKGNVLSIAPADEVAAKEKAAFESAKTAVDLEPLVSELIQINYAKASDIAALLKSIKAITTGAESNAHPVFNNAVSITKESTDSNSLLSPRGQVTVDNRTNSILVQDTPGKIREVRKLIAKLDQPVRQVMIESRLVEAVSSFSKSLGAKLGTRNNFTGSSSQIDQAAILNGDNTLSTADGLNVNLPSPGIGNQEAGALALTIAKLGTGAVLGLELSALEQEGKGKIISSPRIVTANGQKAKIEQGQERVFTTSVLGVGTVITKKAVLSLEVTPRITPDDRIIMDVKVSKDNFVDAVRGILNIKDIETQVLLDNGETIVIGGIYELDRNDTDTKVPFFGDLPLLGWLFKNQEVVDNKTELLIFLTPRIMAELASVR